MKPTISIIILLHFYFFSIGQYIKQETRPIGSVDSIVVVVNEFKTEHKILNFELDTINKNINFFLEPVKNIFGSVSYRKWPFVAFDYINQKVRWIKQFDFRKERIVSKNDLYLYYDVNNIYSLNPKNGANELAFKAFQFYNLDYHNNLILAYDKDGYKNQMLSAIDYNTGEILWNDLVYRTAKWNYSSIFSDSLYIVDSQGITFIDPKQGRLAWLESSFSTHPERDTESLDWESTNKSTVASTLIGVTSSVLASKMSGLTVTVFPSFQSNLSSANLDWSSSNILLVDDGLGYYCSKEYLYHFRVPSAAIIESYKDLFPFTSLLWKVKLPSDMTGTSTISESRDTLIMVNHGSKLDTRTSKVVSHERPYIALFNKEDGSLIDYTEIKNVRNVQKFKKDNNKIIAMSKLAIIEYDMNLKKITKGRNVTFRGSGNIEDFYLDSVYVRDANTLVNILEGKDSIIVRTKMGNMLSLDKSFRKSKIDEGTAYFTLYDEIDNTRILYDHKTILLVDKINNEIYGSFDLPGLNSRRGKFFIGQTKNKVSFVDLSGIKIR